MFGLINRGQLSGVVEDEFEHFAMRLKGLWLVEHNEDGSHLFDYALSDHIHVAADLPDNIAYVDLANTFTQNQLISKTRPELQLLTSGTAKARALQSVANVAQFNVNLSYDGAAWNRDDVGQGGSHLLIVTAGEFGFYNTPSGANPAALTERFRVNSVGGLHERTRSTAVGEWQPVTYAGGNYTSDSGSWTVESGDQITLAYTLVGKTMVVSFTLANTAVSGTPNELRIAIPGGNTSARRMDNACMLLDNSAPLGGQVYVGAAGTTINIRKLDTTNFTDTAGAGTTNVVGQITFEIQ